MASEVFDKMKAAFNKGVTTVGVKTTTTVEKQKLKMQISKLTADIKELYFRIGEKAYGSWETNAFSVDLVTGEFEQIKQKNSEITELQKSIEKVNEEAQNAIAASGVIPEKPEKTEKNQRSYICPACKAAFDSPIKFCKKCGVKYVETSAEDAPVNGSGGNNDNPAN